VIRRRRVIVAAAALLTLTTACGHLPPCPAAGGPVWTELASAHFRLRTDENAAAGRTLLGDLEQLQAALLTVFGASPDFDSGRLPVVVVDRGWTAFAASQINGYFAHALFQPLVVMEARTEAFQVDVIKHELVHYLSAKIVPNQPPWFAEGLASYYQTIEYDPTAERVTVGRPVANLLRWAQRIGATTIERVLTVKTIDRDDGTPFYAAAWLTVHYLMNHRAEALVGYEKALRTGATPESAWAAAFGSETPAQLASDVVHYVDGGQYEVRLYHLAAATPPAPAERTLNDADTHATRALLYLTGAGTRALAPELSMKADDPQAAAKREVEEALRADRGHVTASAIAHFMLNAPVDLAQATAATRNDAGDWLAWLILADGLRLSGNRAGSNEALTRAVGIARADRSVDLPVVSTERD
jgi:tetratricopeptide (TPR) repeat protein